MSFNAELTVAIMGATGTGKSTFVNLASGSHFQVGQSLRSCTAAVQVSEPFSVSGRRMRLVDTPGFDDTTKSDTEILRMIADHLAADYRQDKKLSGIIYMHRISDLRMSGVSKRNFSMYRNLCGEKTLRNVVIVTNMWGEIDPSVGAAREQELATDDILFKPVLDKGAIMLRHLNTVESAHAILQRFVDNHPEALAIQREVVDESRNLDATAAGLELQEEMRREIEEAQRRQAEELRRVQEAMAAAARAHELRQAEEIANARKAMEEETRRAQLAHQQELARQDEERRREEQQRAELERARLAEIEAQRVIAEEQRRLQEEMASRARAAEEEQARMREEIARRMRRAHRHGGGCTIA
ncbi:hypothetical protein EIP91_011482 [Steccherinum ochraceum]|uniref:G domain-containing protein n=1 Tax=Steccherinum ochraceum TaxID=92696 RepID=A0A4V2MWY8_9APHY|nr:hypothetical protein EIP91_011482 [Steccherinum ochraceum]